MKLEIKTGKDGFCEYFKLNGKKFGQGIMGYEINHNAGEKPIVIIKCKVDDFILKGEDDIIFFDNLKKKSLFKRIIEKFKRGVK